MTSKKVVLNKCYGGFGLSRKAVLRMRELGSEWARGIRLEEDEGELESYAHSSFRSTTGGEIPHDDAVLVQVVEELGEEANGSCAKLRVEQMWPGESITEHDGFESIRH